jgi:hypothetical protein
LLPWARFSKNRTPNFDVYDLRASVECDSGNLDSSNEGSYLLDHMVTYGEKFPKKIKKLVFQEWGRI